MGKMKLLLGAPILLFSSIASAAIIERDVSVDLDSAILSKSQIFDSIYFDSVTLDVGDTFIFNMDFGGDALRVKDTGVDSEEYMGWLSVPSPSGSNTGFHWDTRFIFGGVKGELLTNDFVLGFGGPIGAFLPHWNLTNSSFSFSNISLIFDIDFKEPGRDSYVTEQINFSASFVPDSGQFKSVKVPTPTAIWLFGIGLIGLIGFNRRRITT